MIDEWPIADPQPMTTGLTLRFLRDDEGEPRVMYIRDLMGVCPVCGRELIERTYAQTSYHHLTVGRFRQLAREAPQRLEQTCEQCGERLTGRDTRRWTLTYGFPLSVGLMQAFGASTSGAVAIEYAVTPHRWFDAQMQPEFDVADDQSVVRLATLDEDEVFRVTGRFLSLKGAWRRALVHYLRQADAEPVWLPLAPGCYALIAPSRARAEAAMAQRLADYGGSAGWVTAPLSDRINALVDHGPHEWLPEGLLQSLAEERFFALAAGSLAWAASALPRCLGQLPVETVSQVDDDYSASIDFPVGSDEWQRVALALPDLMLEALISGMAPSDRLALFVDDQLVQLVEGAR